MSLQFNPRLESAIQSKATSAVNNEYATQEETGHVPDYGLAVKQAYEHASLYAAEIGEEYRHEIECTPEQLQAAIVSIYGFKVVHGKRRLA